MEKKLLLSLAVSVMAVTAMAKDKTDPVLMTVAGQPVTLSEFEYLYNKNNAQQVTPQPLQEYVDMFAVYKLKVADARAAGVDTTARFIKEFNGYRDDLAAPYLRDAAVEEKLLHDAYAHKLENVDIDHLMLPLSPEGKLQADSLRKAIDGGADFYELVKQYSIDPSKQYNNGHIGWLPVGVFPYSFEEAAYNTPTGSVSPVFETQFGYHIIRNNGRRADQGQVLVSHILKTFSRERSEQSDAAVKAAIDSIYALVTVPGADFGAIAKAESDDHGSAANNGQLPWFGTGRMVAEFENAAFALQNGEISRPFASQFGYHIIHRIDSRSVASFEEERAALLEALKADPDRADRARLARLDELKAAYASHVDEKTLQYVKAEIERHGCYDSALAASFATCTEPFIIVNGAVMTVADYFKESPIYGTIETTTAFNRINAGTNRIIDEKTTEAEKAQLETKYPEFRNLINEYRDGMMLFEISNARVWDKSSTDIEGLDRFFRDNIGKYAFETPRFKGFLISATSDSIAQAVDAYLAANEIDLDSIGVELRRNFPRNIKVERVVLPKGSNAMVDAIAFGGPKPDMSGNQRWKAFTSYKGRMINGPEEPADVRGAVTSDYQAELERQWIEELRGKYPVVINKKVLKKVK